MTRKKKELSQKAADAALQTFAKTRGAPAAAKPAAAAGVLVATPVPAPEPSATPPTGGHPAGGKTDSKNELNEQELAFITILLTGK
jgi:hypothetical protein